jgi:hypothetical protein
VERRKKSMDRRRRIGIFNQGILFLPKCELKFCNGVRIYLPTKKEDWESSTKEESEKE